jgi:hypothetical protein
MSLLVKELYIKIQSDNRIVVLQVVNFALFHYFCCISQNESLHKTYRVSVTCFYHTITS